MTVFYRLFKLFLFIIITPLFIMGVFLYYYQNYSKKEIILNYTAVGTIVADNISDGRVLKQVNERLARYRDKSLWNINIVNWLILFFVMATLTVSYFAALSFSKEVSAPVESLTRAALRVAKNDFSLKVCVLKAWGEFEILTGAFNEMMSRLERYQNMQRGLLLEEKNKNDILNAAAHDLRAPLLGLQAYLMVLKGNSPAQEEKIRIISAMESSVKTLTALIESVLDVSKTGRGLIAVNRAPFNLRNAVENVIAAVKPLADEKNVELRNEIPPETTVNADANLIERVLQNLISNGLKFTDGGSVTAAYKFSDGGHLISVTDTGAGVAKRELRKIFDKYRASRGKGGGYGLGLAIARRVVAAHGGKIKAESKKGKGAKISFTLPEL
jgi:signal transduction histidine kinase